MWAIREGLVRGEGRYLDEGYWLLRGLHDKDPWVKKQCVWVKENEQHFPKVFAMYKARLVWVVTKEERRIRTRLYRKGWREGMTQARDFARECENDYLRDVGKGDLYYGASYIADRLNSMLHDKDPEEEEPGVPSVWDRL